MSSTTSGDVRMPSTQHRVRNEPSLVLQLAAQRKVFKRKAPAYKERVEALRMLERALLRRQPEIVAAARQDLAGRPAEETLALELFPLLGEIRSARRSLKARMAPRRASFQWEFLPATAQVVYQPLGVVGVLSSWNFPFFLSLAPLAGILAAGNHALIKPSELAPASAELIREIIADCFSPDYVSVITGGPDLAADFSYLPFDHLLCTGSPGVGRPVQMRAGEHVVPVTLELAGKSPAIVHESYPIELAAERIIIGKLNNAGQTCMAPDYAFVPCDRVDDFIAAAKAAVARMYPGLAEGRDYTRIVDARHYHRLNELLDDARRLGAEVITLGGTADPSTRLFPPTIVTNVTEDMALMREEIFGPILPIAKYRDLDDALDHVSSQPHPLALYYFDGDRGRVGRVISRISAGGVTINDCVLDVGQTGLPFGGVGTMGLSRDHGFDRFETFSHRKGVPKTPGWTPLTLLRPPYSRWTRKTLNQLVH